MAVDMFIKIGNVKGESGDADHKGEIDLLSWSWGASQHGSGGIGGGGGSGKVAVQDLTITKYVDNSTPTLFKMCCDGTHIDSVILTVRKAGGNKSLEYLTIALDTAIISGITTGGSSTGDRITEQISLNFTKVAMQYKPQDAKGGAAPAVSTGWDLSGNIAWETKFK
jgi:type VI secretion system secreted protein Hcp